MNHQVIGKPGPLTGEVLLDPPPVNRDPTLAMLDVISFVMERLVVIPGTKQRAGLNSVLMLVPVLGDVIPTMVSLFILTVGLSHYRVPRIVAIRMMLNSLLDAALGWIPVVGELFDLFFKADTRNVRLLQEYAGQGPPRSTWRHWAFVLGLVGAVGLVLVLLVLGAVALIQFIVNAVRGTS